MVYSFGDLNLDVYISFRREGMPSATRDLPSNADIQLRPGGVAYNFAQQMKARGVPVRIVGCVGNDFAGEYILKELSHNERRGISLTRKHPTGTGAILQFASTGVAEERIAVHSESSANAAIKPNAVDALLSDLGPGDVLFVTGYSLFRSGVEQAARAALARAQRSGSRVIFDLLPHDLSSIGKPDDVQNRIQGACSKPFDLCIGEVRTWRYLTGCLIDTEILGPSELVRLAQAARPFSRYVSLRYGAGNCSREAVFFDGTMLWDRETGYATADPKDKLGYGDRLTCDLVTQFFLRYRVWDYKPKVRFTIPESVVDLLPLGIDRSQPVLDVGCGYGRLYGKFLSVGFENVTGIEPSLSMVEAARWRHPEILTLHGDLLSTNLQARHYSLIAMVGVLTGFQDNDVITRHLEAAARLLSAGGILFIADFAVVDSAAYAERYRVYRAIFPDAPFGTFIATGGAVQRHFQPNEVLHLLGQDLQPIDEVKYLDTVTVNGNPAKAFVLMARMR